MGAHPPGHVRGYHPNPHGEEEPYDSDRRSIYETHNDNPNEIVTYAPQERFRLGYFDVMCLVLNRMIGESLEDFLDDGG